MRGAGFPFPAAYPHSCGRQASEAESFSSVHEQHVKRRLI